MHCVTKLYICTSVMFGGLLVIEIHEVKEKEEMNNADFFNPYPTDEMNSFFNWKLILN